MLAQTVYSTLDALPSCSILLIDDASTDDTRQIAQRLAEESDRVSVHTLDRRVGKGNALKLGLESAGRDRRVYVVLNADLGRSARDIRRLVGPILSGDAAVVSSVSERDVFGYFYRLLRLFGRWTVQAAVADAEGDAQQAARRIQYPVSGEKAFSATAYPALVPGLRGGYGSGLGMIIDALNAGLTVVEVPTGFKNAQPKWSALRSILHRFALLRDVVSVAHMRFRANRTRARSATRAFFASLFAYSILIYLVRLSMVGYLVLMDEVPTALLAFAFSIVLFWMSMRSGITSWSSQPRSDLASDSSPPPLGIWVVGLAGASVMLSSLLGQDSAGAVTLFALPATFVLEAPFHAETRPRRDALATALALGVLSASLALLVAQPTGSSLVYVGGFFLVGIVAGLAVLPVHRLQALTEHAHALYSVYIGQYAFARPSFRDDRELVRLARLGQILELAAGDIEDVQDAHERIATKIAADLGFDYVIIKLVDERANTLVDYAASKNLTWDLGTTRARSISNRKARFGESGGLVGICAETGRPWAGSLDDVRSRDKLLALLMQQANCGSLALAPIGRQGHVVGVVAAALRKSHSFPLPAEDPLGDERVQGLQEVSRVLSPLLSYARAGTMLLQQRMAPRILERFHHHYRSQLAQLQEDALRARASSHFDPNWNSPQRVLRSVTPTLRLMIELERLSALGQTEESMRILPSITEVLVLPVHDYCNMLTEPAGFAVEGADDLGLYAWSVPSDLALDLLMCEQHVFRNVGHATGWTGMPRVSIESGPTTIALRVENADGAADVAPREGGRGLALDSESLGRYGVLVESGPREGRFTTIITIPKSVLIQGGGADADDSVYRA